MIGIVGMLQLVVFFVIYWLLKIVLYIPLQVMKFSKFMYLRVISDYKFIKYLKGF